MAIRPLSPPNNQDPPRKLLVRSARVATGGAMNTVRVPGDSFANHTDAWFTNDAPPVTYGNQVKYFVDGPETFHEMIWAIRTAHQPGHFIYLLNWWLDVDFELSSLSTDRSKDDGTDRNTLNLKALFTKADNDGVMIRAMAWDQQFKFQNDSSVEFINTLKHGAAIRDSRGNEYLLHNYFGLLPDLFSVVGKYHFGSQHQKVLCVYGEQGLLCFCGGVDFNSDRNHTQGGGSSLHDMHCRVLGPAALELVKIFIQRWTDHPDGQRLNGSTGFQPQSLVPASSPAPAGSSHITRIARTFGRDPHYTFAPFGERTAANTLLHAIRNAKQFIYTEDQYFTGNDELLAAFQQAFNNGLRHLTVVLAHWRISDMPLVVRHRRDYIRKLRNMGGDRVRIFALNPITGPDENVRVPSGGGQTEVVGPTSSRAPEDKRSTDPLFPQFDRGEMEHTYVHAKYWVIDDEFVSIGSVNHSRRSYYHDSEAIAATHDTSSDELLMYRLARGSRIRVWQEHLGMQGAEGEAQLAYGVASGVHWLKRNRPLSAVVREYNENEESDGRDNLPVTFFGPLLNDTEVAWNLFIDPA